MWVGLVPYTRSNLCRYPSHMMLHFKLASRWGKCHASVAKCHASVLVDTQKKIQECFFLCVSTSVPPDAFFWMSVRVLT